MLSRLELSLFSPPVLCRHAELWRTALKWYNLWQTPNWWANGQANKLASPLCGQSSPTPDLSDPPGHPVPAVTVSSLKVWEVVGLLFLTSFRAFNSQLTIQASVPPHMPQFVFLALLFFPSVPAGSWSYKCLDREELNSTPLLSLLALMAVFTHAADPKTRLILSTLSLLFPPVSVHEYWLEE